MNGSPLVWNPRTERLEVRIAPVTHLVAAEIDPYSVLTDKNRAEFGRRLAASFQACRKISIETLEDGVVEALIEAKLWVEERFAQVKEEE